MISNIFLISRSILFWINIVFSVLIFGPVTFLAGTISYDLCLYLSKKWCRYNLLFLKYVVNSFSSTAKVAVATTQSLVSIILAKLYILPSEHITSALTKNKIEFYESKCKIYEDKCVIVSPIFIEIDENGDILNLRDRIRIKGITIEI